MLSMGELAGGFLKQVLDLLHSRGRAWIYWGKALTCQMTSNNLISLIYLNFIGDFRKGAGSL